MQIYTILSTMDILIKKAVIIDSTSPFNGQKKDILISSGRISSVEDDINPALADEGKNPFTLDSKEPTGDYKAFLLGETRYASLMKARPETAEKLFEKTEKDSKDRLAAYKHLANK